MLHVYFVVTKSYWIIVDVDCPTELPCHCALMCQCVHVQAIINGHLSKSRKTAFKKGDRWCDFKETSPGCGPHQERRRTGTWFNIFQPTSVWKTQSTDQLGNLPPAEKNTSLKENGEDWRNIRFDGGFPWFSIFSNWHPPFCTPHAHKPFHPLAGSVPRAKPIQYWPNLHCLTKTNYLNIVFIYICMKTAQNNPAQTHS